MAHFSAWITVGHHDEGTRLMATKTGLCVPALKRASFVTLGKFSNLFAPVIS